mmetsp:Transcript_1170/g.2632  ORF Transcript_1170/g.2632 Transcript_1170/m.2632 type:complete len:234 (-) Transcript_1170:462-1163(-)
MRTRTRCPSCLAGRRNVLSRTTRASIYLYHRRPRTNLHRKTTRSSATSSSMTPSPAKKNPSRRRRKKNLSRRKLRSSKLHKSPARSPSCPRRRSRRTRVHQGTSTGRRRAASRPGPRRADWSLRSRSNISRKGWPGRRPPDSSIGGTSRSRPWARTAPSSGPKARRTTRTRRPSSTSGRSTRGRATRAGPRRCLLGSECRSSAPGTTSWRPARRATSSGSTQRGGSKMRSSLR